MSQISIVEMEFFRQVASLAQALPQSKHVQVKYQHLASREFPRILAEIDTLHKQLERIKIALYLGGGFGALLLLSVALSAISS